MPKIIWRSDGERPPGTKRRAMWPLYLISVGAVLAVWSGWVELGAMCGFGIEQPLYGIWNGLKLNAAISLPLSMEAYGFYAMGFWFDPDEAEGVRTYARWTTILAYSLGFAAQATYHVLAAMHMTHAPIPVVVFVSGVPVATICVAGGLLHKHIEARKAALAGDIGGLAGTGVQPAPVLTDGPAAPRPEAVARAEGESLAAPEEAPAPQPVRSPEPSAGESPAAAGTVTERPAPEERPANVVRLPDEDEKAALRAELADMAPEDRIKAASSMTAREFGARFGYGKSRAAIIQREIKAGEYEGGAASGS